MLKWTCFVNHERFIYIVVWCRRGRKREGREGEGGEGGAERKGGRSEEANQREED